MCAVPSGHSMSRLGRMARGRGGRRSGSVSGGRARGGGIDRCGRNIGPRAGRESGRSAGRGMRTRAAAGQRHDRDGEDDQAGQDQGQGTATGPARRPRPAPAPRRRPGPARAATTARWRSDPPGRAAAHALRPAWTGGGRRGRSAGPGSWGHGSGARRPGSRVLHGHLADGGRRVGGGERSELDDWSPRLGVRPLRWRLEDRVLGAPGGSPAGGTARRRPGVARLIGKAGEHGDELFGRALPVAGTPPFTLPGVRRHGPG